MNYLGKTYENCDLIRFYDINIKQSSKETREVEIFLKDFLSSASQGIEFNPLDLNDVSIIASYHKEVPVSGAVTIDLTAKYHGWPLKAGFDYDPEHQVEQKDPETEEGSEETVEIL